MLGFKTGLVLPRLEQTKKYYDKILYLQGFPQSKHLFEYFAPNEQTININILIIKKPCSRGIILGGIIIMSKDLIASKNVQRHAFQLTINNPLNYGFDHHNIKETLVVKFSTLKYFCMADEISETGTPHTHIYVCFSSRVRFSTIKKHFTEAHIEPAHGTVQDNLDYIKKVGRHESKANTCIEGTYEEWGTIPTQKGTNADMADLYELIENGYTNAEILAINHDHILNIDKLDKVRTMLLTEKFKNTRRLDLKVIYISGATGTGKTRGVLDVHGDSNVYRVSDYHHPFDGYSCQPILVFDEYRSNLRLSDMLNFCDIYPIELPARYANKFACFNTIYIISNWDLEDQYKEVQVDNPESWKAFLRRIHEIKIYSENGNITTYNSVEEYMNRDKSFHKLTETEKFELPFNK